MPIGQHLELYVFVSTSTMRYPHKRWWCRFAISSAPISGDGDGDAKL